MIEERLDNYPVIHGIAIDYAAEIFLNPRIGNYDQHIHSNLSTHENPVYDFIINYFDVRPGESCVYVIRFLDNTYYVGSTHNMHSRWKNHNQREEGCTLLSAAGLGKKIPTSRLRKTERDVIIFMIKNDYKLRNRLT